MRRVVLLSYSLSTSTHFAPSHSLSTSTHFAPILFSLYFNPLRSISLSFHLTLSYFFSFLPRRNLLFHLQSSSLSFPSFHTIYLSPYPRLWNLGPSLDFQMNRSLWFMALHVSIKENPLLYFLCIFFLFLHNYDEEITIYINSSRKHSVCYAVI